MIVAAVFVLKPLLFFSCHMIIMAFQNTKGVKVDGPGLKGMIYID